MFFFSIIIFIIHVFFKIIIFGNHGFNLHSIFSSSSNGYFQLKCSEFFFFPSIFSGIFCILILLKSMKKKFDFFFLVSILLTSSLVFWPAFLLTFRMFPVLTMIFLLSLTILSFGIMWKILWTNQQIFIAILLFHRPVERRKVKRFFFSKL